MLHSLWFPSIPIAWPAVSWKSSRAFSVSVHFLNYCPPPSFSSSVKNQRWGETNMVLKKNDFTQELLQGRKRNPSLELGSTPMATRKSGDLQPRSRVRMTKMKHPEWRGLWLNLPDSIAAEGRPRGSHITWIWSDTRVVDSHSTDLSGFLLLVSRQPRGKRVQRSLTQVWPLPGVFSPPTPNFRCLTSVGRPSFPVGYPWWLSDKESTC